ncbi:hypothetical protein GCK72_007011 [Caenorhabditis remanei]|uniref:Uncharacterized protein n=1 Tax=Caenorhabditis remanei TaxID=31234 RepID=A0A6A5HKZ2_CAERE|nr:hypothetical protein GCK72_007011 [Caenorhabditis remanei]KAF1767053.1 hypothetical protein GCK72_007011 [Caenorhabditis remanei]
MPDLRVPFYEDIGDQYGIPVERGEGLQYFEAYEGYQRSVSYGMPQPPFDNGQFEYHVDHSEPVAEDLKFEQQYPLQNWEDNQMVGVSSTVDLIHFPGQNYTVQHYHQHGRNDEVVPFEQFHAHHQATLSVTENPAQPQVDDRFLIRMNGMAPDKNTLIAKWMEWKKTVQKHPILDSLDLSCYLFDCKRNVGVPQWKKTAFDGYKFYQAEKQESKLWRQCTHERRELWNGAVAMLKAWQNQQRELGLIKLSGK